MASLMAILNRSYINSPANHYLWAFDNSYANLRDNRHETLFILSESNHTLYLKSQFTTAMLTLSFLFYHNDVKLHFNATSIIILS